MENKEDIVKRLKLLLTITRAGSDIVDLILNDEKDRITILFQSGATRQINIEGDSGIAIIKDVIKGL